MFKNIKLKKALLGASLGLLGVGAVVGSTVVYNNYIVHKEVVEESKFIVDGKEVNSGATVDMPSSLIFTRYAQANSNENALTLKASVSPSYAVNKNLSWSLSWADGGSYGTLTDYISLNVSEDTSTCSVQVNQSFTHQIKLTVSTVDGSNVSKECTIDYLGRNIQNNFGATTYSCTTSTTDIINDVKNSTYRVYGGSLNSGISVIIDDVYFALVDDPGCDYVSITQCAKDVLVGGYTLIEYFEYLHEKNQGYQDFEVDNMIQCAEMEGMGFFVTYHLDYNGSTYYSTSTPFSVGSSAGVSFSDCLVTDITLSDSSFIF